MSGFCTRTDCFAYNRKHLNNCGALSETYEDDHKCPWFKKESDVDEKTKKLLRIDDKK